MGDAECDVELDEEVDIDAELVCEADIDSDAEIVRVLSGVGEVDAV